MAEAQPKRIRWIGKTVVEIDHGLHKFGDIIENHPRALKHVQSGDAVAENSVPSVPEATQPKKNSKVGQKIEVTIQSEVKETPVKPEVIPPTEPEATTPEESIEGKAE